MAVEFMKAVGQLPFPAGGDVNHEQLECIGDAREVSGELPIRRDLRPHDHVAALEHRSSISAFRIEYLKPGVGARGGIDQSAVVARHVERQVAAGATRYGTRFATRHRHPPQVGAATVIGTEKDPVSVS
jgi:hypothetical protein